LLDPHKIELIFYRI